MEQASKLAQDEPKENKKDSSQASWKIDLDIEELKRYQAPVPRYTSYPTSPSWQNMAPDLYERKLEERQRGKPVSIYIHVPFCKTMCLFCGCHVILNRREDLRREYARILEKEIDLVFQKTGSMKIKQLHLGGGTPTYMPFDELDGWLKRFAKKGDISKESEISIEIDPRTMKEKGLEGFQELKSMGFNRISFGVQDTNEDVQEAIRRRQSAALSKMTFEMAKQAGFDSINIDLIYGLPLQTEESFQKTVEQVGQWRPSRIALFSFAYVPWHKAQQRAIPVQQLPEVETKLRLYLLARQHFLSIGYIAIGMDHFALESDEMVKAYRTKNMQRNFQGYSLKLSEDLIGIGVSSTGYVDGLYIQNLKDIPVYRDLIESGRLATYRGHLLNLEDTRRRFVIQKLMCDFEITFQEYEKLFARSFQNDFGAELKRIKLLSELVTVLDDRLEVTNKGIVFIRIVASCFDAYLHPAEAKTRFSMLI